MDLHDYKDVAENYDRYLEVMYQTENNYDGFIQFYTELAKRYGAGGIIDIACGTGAVALGLAEQGIIADASDLSEEMCNVARKKAQDKGYKLRIFRGDMTTFDAGRTYSLAIIARSGFMHLPTPEIQRAALLNIRSRLCDGGILTLNTFDPLPSFQTEQMKNSDEDHEFRLEYINADGNREKIYTALSYDPVSQILKGSWKFETLDEKGNVIAERIRPLTMRQTYRQEMKWLIELCGFEIEALYSGYKFKPADELTPSDLVWVLKKV